MKNKHGILKLDHIHTSIIWVGWLLPYFSLLLLTLTKWLKNKSYFSRYCLSKFVYSYKFENYCVLNVFLANIETFQGSFLILLLQSLPLCPYITYFVLAPLPLSYVLDILHLEHSATRSWLTSWYSVLDSTII